MFDPKVASGLPQPGDWQGGDGLRRLQQRRLPEAVRWACRVPANRDRVAAAVETLEDLSRIPTIDKEDLRAAYPFGLAAVDREEIATYHESSGTSGTPTSSFFTTDDWADVVSRFTRNAVGVTARDTLLVRTPYAMLTTGHQAHLAGLFRGAMVVPADNRSAVVTHARVVRLLRELAVTVAWCLPTECLLWAAAARAAGLRPDTDFPALRAFVVAGEPLGEARRRRIERLWGVPVFQDYGSTETGSLAGSCPAGRMHLWADRFVAQVHDPATGRDALTGTGELVITTLYRRAMPLLRYNLRDLVRISDAECPCGLDLPTVQVLGRQHGGVPVSGVPVTPQQLEDAVFGLPPEWEVLFWRARSTGEALHLQVEVAPEHQADAARTLRETLRERLGVRVRVQPVPPGAMVPRDALRTMPRFVKPRSLFARDEDWDQAVSYW